VCVRTTIATHTKTTEVNSSIELLSFVVQALVVLLCAQDDAHTDIKHERRDSKSKTSTARRSHAIAGFVNCPVFH